MLARCVGYAADGGGRVVRHLGNGQDGAFGRGDHPLPVEIPGDQVR